MLLRDVSLRGRIPTPAAAAGRSLQPDPTLTDVLGFSLQHEHTQLVTKLKEEVKQLKFELKCAREAKKGSERKFDIEKSTVVHLMQQLYMVKEELNSAKSKR